MSNSNKVVLIDSESYNENNDRNWRKHALYIDFVKNLKSDYKNTLNDLQKKHPSYRSSLREAKHCYPLFQVYLKIIAKIGENVDHLRFAFRINKNKKQNNYSITKVHCVIDIYYVTSFIQTIVIINHPPNQYQYNQYNQSIPSSKPKQQSKFIQNEDLIHTVQKQKLYNHNILPIRIKHNPTKLNPLQTNAILSNNYNHITVKLSLFVQQINSIYIKMKYYRFKKYHKKLKLIHIIKWKWIIMRTKMMIKMMKRMIIKLLI